MPCACFYFAYVSSMLATTAPATIQLEMEGWSNQSWGFHAIERGRTTCEVSIAADGSRRNRCIDTPYKHFFWKQPASSIDILYLAPQNAGYQLDHSTRTAQGGECACTWTLEISPADSGCVHRSGQLSWGTARPAGRGRIAGYEVLRFTFEEERDGSTTEFALAPALACEVMEHITTYPGTLGIPGARYTHRVTSFIKRHPDPSLFRIPPGFTIRR